MAEIYSNSYLILAATHSAEGEGSLCPETLGFQVSSVTPERDDYCLLFRRRIDHHIDRTENSDHYPQAIKIHATVNFHPLLKKAWVYQERILSTRVLHFGPYEIYFECRTTVQCECGNIGWQDTSNDTPIAQFEAHIPLSWWSGEDKCWVGAANAPYHSLL